MNSSARTPAYAVRSGHISRYVSGHSGYRDATSLTGNFIGAERLTNSGGAAQHGYEETTTPRAHRRASCSTSQRAVDPCAKITTHTGHRRATGSSSQHAADPYENNIGPMHRNTYGNPTQQVKGLHTPPGRTPLADRDPEQFVTLLANNIYLSDKRKPTMFLMKRDPNMVQFTKDNWYSYVNVTGNQRYHMV